MLSPSLEIGRASESPSDSNARNTFSASDRVARGTPARAAETTLILPVPALMDKSVTPLRVTVRAGPTHDGANAETLAMHATPVQEVGTKTETETETETETQSSAGSLIVNCWLRLRVAEEPKSS